MVLLWGVSAFPENRNKKTVIVRTFCNFSFCQYDCRHPSGTPGNALVTTGAPQRSAPIPALQGGLLSKNEAGQHALAPGHLLEQSEHCLKLSTAAAIATAALHVLNRSFFISKESRLAYHLSPGQLHLEMQLLMRAAWTILADMSWAWASFLTLSRWSFSTLAAISVMAAFAVKFIWSTTAVSPTSPFINSYICILVKAWSW